MLFRNEEFDDVIIIDTCTKSDLETKILKIANEYIIIDLQYAMVDKLAESAYSALILVRRGQCVMNMSVQSVENALK